MFALEFGMYEKNQISRFKNFSPRNLQKTTLKTFFSAFIPYKLQIRFPSQTTDQHKNDNLLYFLKKMIFSV